MGILKKKLSWILVICMVITLVPTNAWANHKIEEGQLDVPDDKISQLTYPLDVTPILEDGTNFFDNPTSGWYLLDGDISDDANMGSNMIGYNLILKKGSIKGNDVSWYCDNVNWWGLNKNSDIVDILDGWIDGTNLTINSGNISFHRTYINTPINIKGGKIGFDSQCSATAPLNINGGHITWDQLGNGQMEWSGDISIRGGYVTMKNVDTFGGNFSANDNATVLVNTTMDDSRFDNLPNGIVFKGDKGIVHGNVRLLEDYTVMQGATLVIPKGSTLKIGENVTLTNLGSIIAEGQFDDSSDNAHLVGNPVEKTDKPTNPTPPAPPHIPVQPIPQEPNYITCDMPKAPLYGMGANIGMMESQQVVAKEIMKNTVDNIVSLGDMSESAIERQIARNIRYGKKVTLRVEHKKLRDDNTSDNILAVEKLRETIDETLGKIDHKIVEIFDIKVIADNMSNTIGNLENLDGKMPFTAMLNKGYKGGYGIVKIINGKTEFLSNGDIATIDKENILTFMVDQPAIYGIYWYDNMACQLGSKNSQVSNIKVSTDNGLLKVDFDKMPEADSYKVYIKQDGVEHKWQSYIIGENSLVIRKLDGMPLVKNGKYQIKVAARFRLSCNIPGGSIDGDILEDNTIIREGIASDTVSVYANRLGSKSANMQLPRFDNVVICKSYGNKVNVKVTGKKVYTKNSPKGLAYQVSYKLKGGKLWKTTGYSSSNVKYIKGLKKGKRYVFAIRYRYVSMLDGKSFVYSGVVRQEKRI